MPADFEFDRSAVPEWQIEVSSRFPGAPCVCSTACAVE
jgi:hypothetical protein